MVWRRFVKPPCLLGLHAIESGMKSERNLHDTTSMNIDPERFTELGISAITEMAEVAKRNGQQEVEVWHLLSASHGARGWNCPRPFGGEWVWARRLSNLPSSASSRIYPRLRETSTLRRSYASAALTEGVEKAQQVSQGYAG